MSKLTEYLMGKREQFIGLELIYNDLKVRDFLDKVDLEGISEINKLTKEESKDLMSNKEVKTVTMGETKVDNVSLAGNSGSISLNGIKEEDSKKEEVSSFSIGKSKLGQSIGKDTVNEARREEISKGLENFLGKF